MTVTLFFYIELDIKTDVKGNTFNAFGSAVRLIVQGQCGDVEPCIMVTMTYSFVPTRRGQYLSMITRKDTFQDLFSIYSVGKQPYD